jgi:hypothetical protein
MHTQTPKIEKDCAEVGAQSTMSAAEIQLQIGALSDQATRQNQQMNLMQKRINTLEDLLRGFAGQVRNGLPARSKN